MDLAAGNKGLKSHPLFLLETDGDLNMKYLACATALTLASGAALAQSSVTLFGVVDATVAVGRGSVSNKTQLANSGLNSSSIGFRGIEDLGGGMAASFWLEASVGNDSGVGKATNTNNQASGTPPSNAGGQGLTFDRRSTVSLSGAWGELRLGRDYTPHYHNHATFEPWKNKGIGTSQVANSSLASFTEVRASNTIGYLLPPMGGFYGQYQHFLGENPSGTATANDGSGDSVRLGYEKGPFNVAAAAGKLKMSTGDITTVNAGASYNLGFATIMGLYDRDSVARGATGHGWELGTEVPIGVGQVRASYSTYKTDAIGNPRSTKVALGYVHNLSKRTALYTTVAHISNGGSATQALNGATTAAGQGSSGLDLGISHRF
jgi:predicted porin